MKNKQIMSEPIPAVNLSSSSIFLIKWCLNIRLFHKVYIVELDTNKVMSNKTSLELKKPVVKTTEVGDEISKGLKRRIEIANQAVTSAEEKIKTAYDYAVKVDKLKPR